MPAGLNTGTPRAPADLLEMYADYKPAHSSNRQLSRDGIMSLAPQYYDPAWYGAVGDGLSHPLSATYATLAAAQVVYPSAVALTDEIDWAATQKALDQAAAAPAGGEVCCGRQGTYLINRSLTQTANVKLTARRGAILKATLANLNMIVATNQTRCIAEGLTLDGNNLGAVGILYNTVTFFEVRRCKITGFTGLNVSGYGGGIHGYLCDDSTVQDNELFGNGVLVGGLTSDIQINGNGVVADCTKRVKIHNNRCSSTAVQTNIVCYDVAYSRATENECSGAKTQASNNNGYGIIFYRTVNANAGSARRNRIENNLVHDVDGTALYSQGQDDCAIVGNIGENWGAVQDDTTLVVGLVGLSNSPRATITGNQGYNGFKALIVIGGLAGNVEGYTVGDNTGTNLNGGYGIYLRGPIQRSAFTSNAFKNCGNGIATPPVDQGIDGCTFESNTVDTTTAGYSYILYGAARCTFIGNTSNGSFRSAFALSGASPGNIFMGNEAWNGSTSADNTYMGFDIVGATDTTLVSNFAGNTAGVGFKWAYFVHATSVRSKVTNNRATGARTANYNVDATYANGIEFWGNYDASLTDAHLFRIRQQLILTGSPTSMVQMLLGDSSVFGAVGAMWASGAPFLAGNAAHVQGADLWHQSNAANASKLVRLALNGNLEFYSAPAGTADGTFATFWGTPQATLVNGGRLNLAGTQVVSTRDTGWTAFAGAAGDKVTSYDPATVTTAQLAGRVKQLQAVMTSHGLIGP